MRLPDSSSLANDVDLAVVVRPFHAGVSAPPSLVNYRWSSLDLPLLYAMATGPVRSRLLHALARRPSAALASVDLNLAVHPCRTVPSSPSARRLDTGPALLTFQARPAIAARLRQVRAPPLRSSPSSYRLPTRHLNAVVDLHLRVSLFLTRQPSSSCLVQTLDQRLAMAQSRVSARRRPRAQYKPLSRRCPAAAASSFLIPTMPCTVNSLVTSRCV